MFLASANVRFFVANEMSGLVLVSRRRREGGKVGIAQRFPRSRAVVPMLRAISAVLFGQQLTISLASATMVESSSSAHAWSMSDSSSSS